MSLARGAVTFSRFRIEPHSSSALEWSDQIADGLQKHAFEPLVREGPDERAAGFVELENADATEFGTGDLHRGEYALFSWRVDEFRIPAAAVKAELERWAKAFELEQERPPRRREKQEAKQQIHHEMKSRAPIITRTFDVSLNTATLQAQIWAASRKLVDEIQDALSQALNLRLLPMTPALVAEGMGFSEKTLSPTPLLSLPEKGQETARG